MRVLVGDGAGGGNSTAGSVTTKTLASIDLTWSPSSNIKSYVPSELTRLIVQGYDFAQPGIFAFNVSPGRYVMGDADIALLIVVTFRV